MKPIHYLVLFLLLFGGSSCFEEFSNLEETLTQDLDFYLGTDLLDNPMLIQILDIQTGEPLNDVTVEKLEADFSEVYTIGGALTLDASGGVLLLGVPKEETPTDGAAKSIRLHFNAPGYLPMEQTFFVVDSSTSEYLVFLKNPSTAEDIGQLEERFSSNLTDEVYSNLPNGLGTFRIDRNTVFRDEFGNVLNGNGRLNVTFYQGTEENKQILQESLSGAPIMLDDGNVSELELDALAVMDIDLTVGGTAAVDLSYPLEVSVPLDRGMENPQTGQAIRAGDFIPAYSMDENVETWEEDGFAIVMERNGQLEAVLDIPHLSRWAIGFSSLNQYQGQTDKVCQAFIYLKANVTDTIRGEYYVESGRDTFQGTDMNGMLYDSIVIAYDTVQYEYLKRPDRCIIRHYLQCELDLFKEVEKQKELAIAYYQRQDNILFTDLDYQEEVRLYVLENPPCPNHDPTADFLIPIRVQSQHFIEGFLAGSYPGGYLYQGARLEPGTNTFFVNNPNRPLLQEGAYFHYPVQFYFYYYNPTECRWEFEFVQSSQCAFANGMDLLVEAPANIPAMTQTRVNVVANCPDNPELPILPTIPVQYRPSCPDNDELAVFYSILGTVYNGMLEEELPLRVGETYDFRVKFEGLPLEFENITIPVDRAEYQFGETTVIVEIIDGAIHLDLGTITVPEGICDAF